LGTAAAIRALWLAPIVSFVRVCPQQGMGFSFSK
jgi:hypothetical protein